MKPINILQKLNESKIPKESISDNPEKDYDALMNFYDEIERAEESVEMDMSSKKEAYNVLVSNLGEYDISDKLVNYLKRSKSFDNFCSAVDKAMSILDGSYVEYREMSNEELEKMFTSKQVLSIKKLIDSYAKGHEIKYTEPSVDEYPVCASWFVNVRDYESCAKIPSKEFLRDLQNLGVDFPEGIEPKRTNDPAEFEVRGLVNISKYRATIYIGVKDTGFVATRYKINREPTKSDFSHKYMVISISIYFPKRVEEE